MLALSLADAEPTAGLVLVLVITAGLALALVIAGSVLALSHADTKPKPTAGLALSLVITAGLALAFVIAGAVLALALVIGAVLALAHAVPLPAVRIVRTAHCLGQRRVTLGLGCRCELRAQHGHAVDGRASERGRWRGC